MGAVVLDSNVLRSAGLESAEIKFLIDRAEKLGLDICIPQPVLRELEFWLCSRVQSSSEKAVSALRELKGLGVVVPELKINIQAEVERQREQMNLFMEKNK